MKRVVVTGLGVVSSLGDDVNEFWENIVNGRSGIDYIKSFDTTDYDVKLASEVKEYDTSILSKRDLIFDSKYINMARVAANKAYIDSNLKESTINEEEFGIYISTSMGGVEKIAEGLETLKEKGCTRISPLLIPAILPNMASGKVAIDLNAKGSNMATISACSGGANSIGEAYLKIKYGQEKIIVAGASDASITPLSIACFSSMRALYKGNDIKNSSIPFDKKRNGFVIGEGAAILVLEELENAKKRNAKIYSEIVGYGVTCDAYNLVALDTENLTCAKAMRKALKDANITENMVGYINAHGTSTVLNDFVESQAINKIFKSKPFVSSTKSMTGHLMSASGAIEALITVKSLETGIIPANINVKDIDEECNINLVSEKSLKVSSLNYAISNSFGFGGHNVSLVFKKWDKE